MAACLKGGIMRLCSKVSSAYPQHCQHAGGATSVSSTCPLVVSQHLQQGHLQLQGWPCFCHPLRVVDKHWQHATVRSQMRQAAVRCQAAAKQHSQHQHSKPLAGAAQQPALTEDAAEQQAKPYIPDIKIIGLGIRGISSVSSLAATGYLRNADLWAIDADKKGLTGLAAGIHSLEIGAGDDINLSAEQLAALSGLPQQSHVPAGIDMPADGSAGPAFVLGSAAGSPGGTTLLLQLVSHLRRCGRCVVVALTRPFAFEGPRKLEQADILIEALEDVAHLVVVVDQSVLTRAAADLTMQSASAIADKTLQHTVRSLVWALRAPEVLKLSQDGSFQWHGRDLRLMKRPLFPPMMSLLTCPGHAYLGRGQAAIPATKLQINATQLPSMLSTLAEDATRAAAESPFLDDKLSAATAVLCVLILPRSLLQPTASSAHCSSQPAWPAAVPGHQQQQEYALRSAVQVAALAVKELAGPRCLDVVVCPQVEDYFEEKGTGSRQTLRSDSQIAAQPAVGSPAQDSGEADGSLISMECALLVLNQVADEAGQDSNDTVTAEGSVGTAATRLNLGPAAHGSGNARAPAAGSDRASRRRLHSSSPGPAGNEPGRSTCQQTGVPAVAAHLLQGRRFTPETSAPAAESSKIKQLPGAGTQSPRPAWQAMSMIAGASASAAHRMGANNTASTTGSKAAANNVVRRQRPQGAEGAAAAAARAARRLTPLSGATVAANNAVPGPSPGAWQPPQRPPAAACTPNRHEVHDATNPSTGQTAAAAESLAHQLANDETVIEERTLTPHVSGSMATFMVAQSLDLPPRAAQWRHQQRSPPDVHISSSYAFEDAPSIDSEDARSASDFPAQSTVAAKRPSLAAVLLGFASRTEEGNGEGEEEDEEDAAGQDLKSRVAGMLNKERQFE